MAGRRHRRGGARPWARVRSVAGAWAALRSSSGLFRRPSSGAARRPAPASRRRPWRACWRPRRARAGACPCLLRRSLPVGARRARPCARGMRRRPGRGGAASTRGLWRPGPWCAQAMARRRAGREPRRRRVAGLACCSFLAGRGPPWRRAPPPLPCSRPGAAGRTTAGRRGRSCGRRGGQARRRPSAAPLVPELAVVAYLSCTRPGLELVAARLRRPCSPPALALLRPPLPGSLRRRGCSSSGAAASFPAPALPPDPACGAAAGRSRRPTGEAEQAACGRAKQAAAGARRGWEVDDRWAQGQNSLFTSSFS